ncbi:MAG: hypothetical protein JRF51_04965 [Deltaproteobacteria bacterium]|nr:hypothetical protein [Deltaproteobacteria bacterium]
MKKMFGVVAVLFGVLLFLGGVWAADEWESVTSPVKVFEEGYIQGRGAEQISGHEGGHGGCPERPFGGP